MKARPWTILLTCALLFVAAFGDAAAGPADVRRAHAECDAEAVYRFTVAVQHADTGWQHYADRYEILGPDGKVIATRVLRHPHVHEQPFVRAFEGVEVPKSVKQVTVRAHDSLHGYGGREVKLTLRPCEPASAPTPQPDAPANGSPNTAPDPR